MSLLCVLSRSGGNSGWYQKGFSGQTRPRAHRTKSRRPPNAAFTPSLLHLPPIFMGGGEGSLHDNSTSTGHRSEGRLHGAVLAGDACRWVALRYSKCFYRGFRKIAVFENQSRWFRDGNPVVLRPTACAQSGKPDAVAHLGRSIVCATQQWHAPDSDSTVHRSVGRLLGAVLAGDARR